VSAGQETRGVGPLLLRPRWIAGHVLALVLVVSFVNLGFWQLRRLDHRRQVNATIDARSHLPPEALATALKPGEAPREFLPVSATGVYDPAHEVLLRGRSLGGMPGFNLLTPLVLDASAGVWEGSAILVERGWVPYDEDAVPVTAALPPAGTVTLVGELHAPQSPPTGPLAGLAAHDPPTGPLVQSYYVDVTRLAPQMPYGLVPAYLILRQVQPVSPRTLPQPLPLPETDEGPHLGYAIQWFGMALVGIVGYFFLIRSTLKQNRRRAESSRRRS